MKHYLFALEINFTYKLALEFRTYEFGANDIYKSRFIVINQNTIDYVFYERALLTGSSPLNRGCLVLYYTEGLVYTKGQVLFYAEVLVLYLCGGSVVVY